MSAMNWKSAFLWFIVCCEVLFAQNPVDEVSEKKFIDNIVDALSEYKIYFNSSLVAVGVYKFWENQCSSDKKWWQISIAPVPKSYEFKYGKAILRSQNATWSLFKFVNTNVGVGLSLFKEDLFYGKKIFETIQRMIEKKYGGKCAVGHRTAEDMYTELDGKKVSPVKDCDHSHDFEDSCPRKDDWNRFTFWLQNDALDIGNDPNEVNFQFKWLTGKALRMVLVGSTPSNETILLDGKVEQINEVHSIKLNFPTLGCKTLITLTTKSVKPPYELAVDAKLINKKGEDGAIYKLRQKVFLQPEYDDFFHLPSEVEYQDELRSTAMNSFLQTKLEDWPAIGRVFELKHTLKTKYFSFSGNRTVDSWKTGELEEWIFTKSWSDLWNEANHDLSQLFMTEHGKTWEAVKYKSPWVHISVFNKIETEHSKKTVQLLFNPNFIFPSMNLHFTTKEDTRSLLIEVPGPDYAFHIEISLTFVDQNMDDIEWKVTRTDIWSLYQDKVPLLTATTKRKGDLIQLVIERRDSFEKYILGFIDYCAEVWKVFKLSATEPGAKIFSAIFGDNVLAWEASPPVKTFLRILKKSFSSAIPTAFNKMESTDNGELEWLLFDKFPMNFLKGLAKVESSGNQLKITFNMALLPKELRDMYQVES